MDIVFATALSQTTESSMTGSLLPLPQREELQRERPLQQDSTRAAYARDVERFQRVFGGTIPCTAEMLIAYITTSAKRVSPATLLRRCMAIQDAHVRQDQPSPTTDPRIREAMRDMAKGRGPASLLERTNGKAPSVQRAKPRTSKPISRALLLRMLDAMGAGARSLDRRDRMILTLGFAGLKRGVICGLNLEDLRFTEDAMLVRREAGEGGRELAIPITRGPLCAATSCQMWIAHNQWEGQTGPLVVRFTRSGEPTTQRLDAAYVNVVVKGRLKATGVADAEAYSAESLRRGRAA